MVVRQNYVHAINAERIALRTGLRLGQSIRRLFLVFPFPLALFEGIQIVQQVMADFFEIFRHARAGIFFLQFFDDSVDENRSGFLLQVA